MPIIASILLVLLSWAFAYSDAHLEERAIGTPDDLASITFLIAVNSTGKKCLAVTKSPYITRGEKATVPVGDCERVTFSYELKTRPVNGENHTFVDIQFISADASRPVHCLIQWDYGYWQPTSGDGGRSPLPGCYEGSTHKNPKPNDFWFFTLDWLYGSSQENKEYDSVVFLITVNDTWQDCMATVKTLDIAPNTPRNETSNIVIGDCDSGPLVYNITHSEEGNNQHTYIDLVFYSSVIEDASPPTCHIQWDHSYNLPKSQGSLSSILPSCFTADSREGYHMTYYWFYVLEW